MALTEHKRKSKIHLTPKQKLDHYNHFIYSRNLG
jgi:hypothetical protein